MKSSGCGSRISCNAFALEDRQQLVHRLQELRLGGLRRLRPAVELGVDHLDAQVDGDLDDPLPGAYGRLSLVLVRTGPAQHRQHRGDAHPRVAPRPSSASDAGVVDPRVLEERDEVRLGRELHPVVTQAGHDVGQLVDRAASSRTSADPVRASRPRSLQVGSLDAGCRFLDLDRCRRRARAAERDLRPVRTA